MVAYATWNYQNKCAILTFSLFKKLNHVYGIICSSLRVSIIVRTPLLTLKQNEKMISFHEIWYEHYATGRIWFLTPLIIINNMAETRTLDLGESLSVLKCSMVKKYCPGCHEIN